MQSEIYIHLATETNFTDAFGLPKNGEGSLFPLSCIETKDADTWEVAITAPVEAQPLLLHDRIVYLKTRYGYQPFRIGNPEYGDTSVSVVAKHVGFDLQNVYLDFSTSIENTCQQAMDDILSHAIPACSFTAFSDVSGVDTFSILQVSVLDAFIQLAEQAGAYLDFDHFQVRITTSQGADHGESIEYGKNLLRATVIENWDNVVTDLLPVGNAELTLPEEWLHADITYDRPYTKRIAFNTDTEDNLRFVATLYLARYKVPRINYDVRSTVLQNVQLGDTISVIAPKFSILTQVIRYQNDVLQDEIVAVEFGNYQTGLKQLFGEYRANIEASAIRKAQLKIDEVNGRISAIAQNIVLIAGDIENLAQGSTEINQRFDGVTLTINQQVDALAQVQAATDENTAAIDATAEALTLQKTYYDFGPDGQVIGRSDSPAQIRMEYDAESKAQVVVTDGYNDTLLLKSNGVKANNIEVVESFIAGNHKVQKLTGSDSVTIWLPI